MKLRTLVATWPGRLVVLLIIAAVGGGTAMAARANSPAPAAAPKTATVAQGSITQTVSVSGSVNASSQARLSFKTGGKLAKVYVNTGQAVTPRQPLAELDTTDLQSALATAEQGLANAQASYQKQELAAQQTQRSLDDARASAASDVASAQQALAKLQTNYATAKSNFASFSNSGMAGISSFQSSLDTIQSQVDALIAEVELIVGGGDTGDLRNVLNQLMNVNSPPLENAHANSTALLTPALSDYKTARDAVQQAMADYDTAAAAGTDTTSMIGQFDLTQTNYTLAASRLSSAFDTTSSVLASAQSAVTSAQASLNTQVTRDLHIPFDQWRTDLATLYNTVTAEQQSVSTAKLKLSQAATYVPTMAAVVGGSITTSQQNVTSAQERGTQSIQSAQNSVDNIPFNLQSAQVSVENAQTAVGTAQANLDAAVLTAPSAGVVASIANDVGEYVTGGNTNTPFIVLTDTNTMVLHGTIGEGDIAKLKLGQVANVSIDAVSGARMTGKVVSLDPVATIAQGVPVYGVDVEIDVPANGVKAGMSGTADVIIASKQNVLVVPNAAVRTVNGQRGVQVLKDGQIVQTAVQFGISNDTVTEVVSGLAEGDTIVIPQARAGASTQPRAGGGFPGVGGGVRFGGGG